MILSKFLGWEQCSLKEYTKCYDKFGGNFSSNPKVLNYIHQLDDFKPRYLIHSRKGDVDGAICAWNDKILANGTASIFKDRLNWLPIAQDELLMPLSGSFVGFIPFSAKLLSPVQPGKILNSTFSLNAFRVISIFKGIDQFSKKTKSTMKRKIGKFLSLGGEILDNKLLSPDELSEIYAELFLLRRNVKIPIESIRDFINNFRPNIFGKVLILDGKPCAFMLNVRNESDKTVTIDFINIAWDQRYDHLSVGKILMWINAIEAEKQSEDKNLRFSFGRPTADYKNEMCINQYVGRIVSV